MEADDGGFADAFSTLPPSEIPASALPPDAAASSTASGAASSSSGSSAPPSMPSASMPPPQWQQQQQAGRRPQQATSRHSVVVAQRQKGNPILQHLRNVSWSYADIVPDFLVGASAAVLYISLRYHLLHPGYLRGRVLELIGRYKLRVIVCHVDVNDSTAPLHDVSKLAFANEWTLICAWSPSEVARYVETLKVLEHKDAAIIQGRTEQDYASRLKASLTSVRPLNKSDVSTLSSTFGTLRRMMSATQNELTLCPGFGDRKVRALHEAFRTPFRGGQKQQKLSSMMGAGVAAAAREAPIVAEARRLRAHGWITLPARVGGGAAGGVELLAPVPSEAALRRSLDAGAPFASAGAARANALCVLTGRLGNLTAVAVEGAAGLGSYLSLSEALPEGALPEPTVVVKRVVGSSEGAMELLFLFFRHCAAADSRTFALPGLSCHSEGGALVVPGGSEEGEGAPIWGGGASLDDVEVSAMPPWLEEALTVPK